MAVAGTARSWRDSEEVNITTGAARKLYHELYALKGRAEAGRRAAGIAFSQREIEKALGKPPYSIKFRGQAISDWIPEDAAKAKVPYDADVVWALVRLWSDWAGERDPNEHYWRNLIDRAQPARDPKLGLTPLGRLIADYPDQLVLDDLEVHPAVEVRGATGLSPLPAYVEREHDAQLREIVAAARNGQSGIAVLVGGSSTGKTRACWEAVKTLPDGWRLWHPIEPNRAQAVVEHLAEVRPRTVVWLNESQHYLLAQTEGERVASGLRGVLNDLSRAPVLVLGTIWPEYWATLLAVPEPGSGPDLHAQARQLVRAKGIQVRTQFSEKELKDALTIHGADPRLAEALAHASQGEITQYLAGVPALQERYSTAPAAARALIEAAMDGRRLGHGPNLPLSMLKAAVPGYLTEREWDTRPTKWLKKALDYVTNARACRGAYSPLYQPRPRSGRPPLVQPRYRLADYLEQYARLHRRTVRIPGALWDALVNHANPGDCTALGQAARYRGLLHVAVRLYINHAELGDPKACQELIRLLKGAGRMEEALAWYRHAIDAGQTSLLREAIRVLRETGRTEEAGDWLRASAEAGDLYALEELGRTSEALSGYERAAKAGDVEALHHAGVLLRQQGRVDEAIDHFKRAARAGRKLGVGEVADLLDQKGRAEEAIDWLKECADRKERDAWLVGISLLETGKKENADEAFDWFQRAAEAGNALVIGYATNLLRSMIQVEAVELDDAIDWLDGLAQARNGESLGWAAELLQEAGQMEKALDWYRRSAEAGNPRALSRRTKLLHEEGRTDEAIDWLTTLAEDGNFYALREATELLYQESRTEEALGWLTARVEKGDGRAPGEVANLLSKAGRTKEAIDWYWQAAETGDSTALDRTVVLLRAQGRAEEATRLQRYGWGPSGSIENDWDAWPSRN